MACASGRAASPKYGLRALQHQPPASAEHGTGHEGEDVEADPFFEAVVAHSVLSGLEGVGGSTSA
jgi:hypothetical protein